MGQEGGKNKKESVDEGQASEGGDGSEDGGADGGFRWSTVCFVVARQGGFSLGTGPCVCAAQLVSRSAASNRVRLAHLLLAGSRD